MTSYLPQTGVLPPPPSRGATDLATNVMLVIKFIVRTYNCWSFALWHVSTYNVLSLFSVTRPLNLHLLVCVCVFLCVNYELTHLSRF